ncbi:Npun_F0494 family protein [[Phormidium] sp. ETS-05]|uniref:Npun_F0494 family protein n=1 Tax=[Phormidium] sp. ETS-05 TaxID=222819 RepID=UPI0018EEF589|nr:Npun_F0494 family protein [[Phormidium] sp. ETS-05]
MSATKLSNRQGEPNIAYPQTTRERAEIAMRCSPLLLELFAAMQGNSVSLGAIAADAGVKNRYTRSPISELAAESALMWLIQVGILRREVDGQGITDSFRLTPLGRQLVEQWQPEGQIPSATGCDRLRNTINRYLRLPL